MSIVILVGGSTADGNAEHRYLVDAFLQHFGDQITRIVTAEPVRRSFGTRLKRMLKRGDFAERFARWRYPGGYGPDPDDLLRLLRPAEKDTLMPGGTRRAHLSSHNGEACEAILDEDKPDVIVVYGTTIIRSNIFSRARTITLNMHTGLSPWYRGDSTLFWPVYYNEPDKLGVTVHELVESIDGGAIAATARVSYEPGDTEAELFAKGVRAGTQIYIDSVEAALAGTLSCTPQDHSAGREFRWKDRTVAAEHLVKQHLKEWQERAL
ncbi:formyl transferase [Granulosicoccus antarcticus]|uniref:phosphoribosylglycinamide formyltransferase 1 n=1 Tax=Granulosicoccus antarcticus IMCC3135 TaxID=1192854 RepID=A0A2Z2NVL8_9GAMM|nr:formyl transferase [Granulosicoccus antarcticus]ASJ75522.1 Bifunctional polymyxin resistance protein ArnA [Granulosicoccus antarcticus IMCC3135]